METPLTPLDFLRRARKLHGDREAVIDGDKRFTYEQFVERCDRWSAALRRLGVQRGDRVATLAPNTHQHLEPYYAVPQLGAVIVPINYRLVADDFVYLINHSGARSCASHSDYLDAVDSVRERMTTVEHFVALEGSRRWLARLRGDARRERRPVRAPADRRGRPALDQLHQRHHFAPEGRDDHPPQRLGERVGTLAHIPMSPADRYLWTLPMFHANGWTFTWIMTAAGAAHVCVRQVEASVIYRLVEAERITMLCAAPTVLIAIANGPEPLRRGLRRGRAAC